MLYHSSIPEDASTYWGVFGFRKIWLMWYWHSFGHFFKANHFYIWDVFSDFKIIKTLIGVLPFRRALRTQPQYCKPREARIFADSDCNSQRFRVGIPILPCLLLKIAVPCYVSPSLVRMESHRAISVKMVNVSRQRIRMMESETVSSVSSSKASVPNWK